MHNRIAQLERRINEHGKRLHVLRSSGETFRMTRGAARRMNGCPCIAFGVRHDGFRHPPTLFTAHPDAGYGDDSDIIELTEPQLRGLTNADD